MPTDRGHRRILIYSHDSFGLGHLRRCRTIAHALVDHRRDLSVLILSGSPIIGSFSFRSRVDFIRVPGVIKLRRGDYTPLNLEIGIDATLRLRASIIRHAAAVFAPDIFLVDKEPLGLRGEVRETLTMLKARGTVLVLGLRDVMDEPELLSEEWERKHAVSALSDLYDHIWIYGLPQVCDPLAAIPLSEAVGRKIRYTGYLRRTAVPLAGTGDCGRPFGSEPYILVTTGGGGDGAALIDWVLRAYEHDPHIPYPALVVFGPFLHSAVKGGFLERIGRLDRVKAITFDANVESLMAAAAGIVAMGGYNTFCEILSFDRPGLMVPRTVPRMEQFIRAVRGEEMGLVRMLAVDGEREPRQMAAAIAALPEQPRPSEVRIPGLLDGLSVINGTVDEWLSTQAEPAKRLSLVPRTPS
jgi:predicted glycosyltransferase